MRADMFTVDNWNEPGMKEGAGGGISRLYPASTVTGTQKRAQKAK